jgi:two-component system NarL family sensor kinase
MPVRTARIIAWSLVGMYIILAGTGLFLMILANTTPGDVRLPIILFIPLIFVVSIWPVIGARIVSHHPRHPIGWLLFAAFPVAAADLFSHGYASYATLIHPNSLAIPAPIMFWLNVTGLPFVVLSFTLMNLLFPTGKLLSPGWRVAAWICTGSLLVYLPIQALEPGPLALFPSLDNPYAVPAPIWSILAPFYFVLIAVLVLCSLASVISLLLRLRQAQGEKRQQIKWLIIPVTIFWISIPFGLLSEYDPSGMALVIGAGLPLIIVPVLVIAIAFSIFKYRLYDFDIFISRTLVYGTLTVIVSVIYVLTVGSLGALLQAEGSLLISLGATGLVAVLFHPLRERLQRGVNELFFGQRDDPLEALAELGQRLEAAIAPEVVLPTLVENIAQTLKLPYVAISLRSGDKYKIAAHTGQKVEEAIHLPLNYQGETVGQLIAGPRSAGEPFNQADKRLLEHIAHQAGPAAYTVQLTQDLRQSRVRLITAREEERRRLRRDLHDGLGPVLASQGLKIAAASQLLQENPARAQQLLEELAAQAEATVTEIRRLVYDLRPAALDNLGLTDAIRDYAAGLKGESSTSRSLRIDIHEPASGLPGLPAAIEVAAFRITTEALTNITRHASARNAVVSFKLGIVNGGKMLHLEIMDDGVGLTPDHKNGVGMISMRERAEEVGGHFHVVSPPKQGTCVIARLPLMEKE